MGLQKVPQLIIITEIRWFSGVAQNTLSVMIGGNSLLTLQRSIARLRICLYGGYSLTQVLLKVKLCRNKLVLNISCVDV